MLPLDLTIYGAIHQHKAQKNSSTTTSSSVIWQEVYLAKFGKIMVPVPYGGLVGFSSPNLSCIVHSNVVEFGLRSWTPAPLSASTIDVPHSKILHLLCVLHQINGCQCDKPKEEQNTLPGSCFIDN